MDMMIEATEFERSEEQIYPMNGIKIDKGFYTVFELKRRYDDEQKRIVLDSDFQRDFVWKHNIFLIIFTILILRRLFSDRVKIMIP